MPTIQPQIGRRISGTVSGIDGKAPNMKTFTLTIDDLAALCGLLHAKSLVGLSEALFRSFPRDGMPAIKKRLHEHGWIHPAERPNTWHFNEDLMQTLAVAIAPDIAVLANSRAKQKSIVFYMAKDAITEIVVGKEHALVASLPDMNALVAEVMKFLDGSFPAEIAVARVKGEAFDKGHRVLIDERGELASKSTGLLASGQTMWSVESVGAFVHGAIGALRVH